MEESLFGSNDLAPKRGITGTGLKIIALISMLIDHIGAVLVLNIVNTQFAEAASRGAQAEWREDHLWLIYLYYALRLIGRFAFPIFAYLITEGFVYTHSVKSYALKMLIFGLVSEIPFNLAVNSSLLYPDYQNVFFTLLLGLLCIWAIRDLAENRKWSARWVFIFYVSAAVFGAFFLYLVSANGMLSELGVVEDRPALIAILVVAAVGGLVISIIIGRFIDDETRITLGFSMLFVAVFGMVASLFQCDYYGSGVLTIAVMYLFRRFGAKRSFLIGCIALIVSTNFMELTAPLMIIPVMLYNGKRGDGVNKYVFYIFYPLHFLALFLITYLLGYTTFAIK